MPEANDEPSNVVAHLGEVLVSGPGGVAVSFTPEAAAATSDLLARAAVAAEAQRRQIGEGWRAPAAKPARS